MATAMDVASSSAPPPYELERDRGIRLTTLLLTIISSLAVIAVEWAGMTRGAPLIVDVVFAAVPITVALAHILARAGYVLPAGAATVASAAAGVMVVARFAPALLPIASTYLLLAALMILSSQIMAFEVAASLGMANVLFAVAVPSFVPVAGVSSVEVPYVFLFINATFIVFAGFLRSRDREELAASSQEVAAAQARLHEIEARTRALQAEHEVQVKAIEKQAQDQRHLLNAASHELRTPITPLVVQMAAFRMRYEDSLTAEQRRAVGLLDRNLKRMATLVDDLLDIARLENGRLELTLTRCDMAELLEQACNTFEGQASKQEVRLDVTAPALVTVADARRISQVVYNLVGNAVKFSDGGGQVEVAARRLDGGVEVTVHDDGKGFDPTEADRLFRPFGQLDPDGRGTGLGLYISQGIIQQHGGRIWGSSDGPGKGATFGFWIPAPVPAS